MALWMGRNQKEALRQVRLHSILYLNGYRRTPKKGARQINRRRYLGVGEEKTWRDRCCVLNL